MTTAEQADRTARNVLELVQARRQIAAVRAACALARAQYAAMGTRPHIEVSEIDHPPAPHVLDPEEVPA